MYRLVFRILLDQAISLLTHQTDVVHQLVQILVPQVSILIVKVFTHSQHDIVGTIITSLTVDQ